MKLLWQQLDQLLRRRELAMAGETPTELRVGPLADGIVVLAAPYRLFLDWYPLFSRDYTGWLELDWRLTRLSGCLMFCGGR
jgi:hypothetical protein